MDQEVHAMAAIQELEDSDFEDDLVGCGDDDAWEEEEEGEESMSTECLCLFCEARFQSEEATFIHCRGVHQFDICVVQRQHQLDCFGYIKMINYIRSQQNPDPKSIHNSTGSFAWMDDRFMKPQMEDDGLLLFDIEDLESYALLHSDTPHCAEASGTGQPATGGAQSEQAQTVEVAATEHRALLERVRLAEARAQATEEQLQRAVEDLQKMRAVTQDLVMSQSSALPPSECAIQHLRDDEDDAYFGSYGHFSIHQEMLQDKVRTESYRDSMYGNRDLFHNKVVLDVGCGTGILSMFAARAGAKLVVGVDQSDILYQAIDIVRENGLQDKITLVKGRLEDVDLPVKKVDIIISEWMGYLLLFESMLDTVLFARDHYLAEGGVVLPDHCSLHIQGLADPDLHHKHHGYWDDVYGFRMSCMKGAVVQELEASVVYADKAKLVTPPVLIKDLDVCTCQLKDLEFSTDFTLTADRDAQVTALVSYFDIGFTRCPNKVEFSTSPCSPPTHWKQSAFLLEKPVQLVKGEELKGHFILRKNKKDPRSLKVTLTLREKSMTYLMQ